MAANFHEREEHKHRLTIETAEDASDEDSCCHPFIGKGWGVLTL